MYIEFIIIYVLLVIAIAIGVVNLIINIRNKDNSKTGVLSRMESNVQTNHALTFEDANNASQAPQANSNGNGVAFCTKCAHQFPGNEKFCPYCGTPRS